MGHPRPVKVCIIKLTEKKRFLKFLSSDTAKKKHMIHCLCHSHVYHFLKSLEYEESLTWHRQPRMKSPTKWRRLKLSGHLLVN